MENSTKNIYKSVYLINEAYGLVKNLDDVHESVKEAILETATILANIAAMTELSEEEFKIISDEIDNQLDNIPKINELSLIEREKLQKEWNSLAANRERMSQEQIDSRMSDYTSAEVAKIINELSLELGDLAYEC